VNKNRLFAKWKVHILFGGGFLLVFLINVAINFFAGQTFLRATLGALGEIRPVEYVMFILFWYWFARGQQPAPSRPTFTSLNLGGSNH
jgi:hypothetical protein